MQMSLPGSNKLVCYFILLIALGCARSLQGQPKPFYHRLGSSLDQAHADGSRWAREVGFLGGTPTTPAAAVLWFNGDAEARETIILPSGHAAYARIKLLRTWENTEVLDRRSMEALTTNLSNLPNAAEAPLSERIRVSWKQGDRWVSRTYNRTNPPDELIALHRSMRTQFYFLCPEFRVSSIPASPDLAGEKWGLLCAATSKGLLVTGRTHSKTVLVTQSGETRRLSGYMPGTNQFAPGISMFVATPDASNAVYRAGDTLSLIELTTGQTRWKQKVSGYPTLLAVAPDASGVLVYNGDDLDLYDTSSSAGPKHLLHEDLQVQAVDWSPDGKLIAWLEEGVLKVADATGAVKQSVLFRDGVQSIKFSPDSRRIAVLPLSLSNFDLTICDVTSGEIIQRIPLWVMEFVPGTGQMEWSSDGKHLAVNYSSGPLVINDVQKSRPIAVRTRPLASSIAFKMNGRGLIAAGLENDLMHVDLAPY